MKPPARPTHVAPISGELDALLASISEAMDALVAWDVTAFQAAVERQREICEYLAHQSEWRTLPGTAATARRVLELNRVYDRLLRHSVHWTRTIQTILQAGGHSFPSRASVHFRG